MDGVIVIVFGGGGVADDVGLTIVDVGGVEVDVEWCDFSAKNDR